MEKIESFTNKSRLTTLTKNGTAIAMTVAVGVPASDTRQALLAELKIHKRYPKEKELELIHRARLGDRDAMDTLVKGNLLFVVSVANKFAAGSDPIDLIQAGAFGLIKAIHSYDETRGVKLLTHAVWWVRQGITHYMQNNNGLIRVPVPKYVMYRKWHKSVREGTPLDMSKAMQEEMSEMAGIMHVEDLDVSGSDDKDFGKHEMVGNLDEGHQNVEESSTTKYIMSYLNELPTREADLIKRYYGLGGHAPVSLKELGSLVGLSNERARQIINAGRRHLRSIMAKHDIHTSEHFL